MAKLINISTTQPLIPDELKGVLLGGVGQLREAQTQLPSLTQLAQQTPLLEVPGLTGQETDILQQALGVLRDPAVFQSAIQALTPMLSGTPGAGPLTQAAMQQFQTQTLPFLRAQQALQGRGASGAQMDAISRGLAEIQLPLMQFDIQNRFRAAQMLPSLVASQAGQLTSALALAGMPREVALQQAKAKFDQAMNAWATQLETQRGPLQMLPQLIGSQTRATSHETKNWEDWLSTGLQIGGSILSALAL